MTLKKKFYSLATAGLMVAALVAGPVGALVAGAQTAPDVTVTIAKFIDGQMATAASANSASFQMNATWNDANNGGAGSGQFSLGPTGFNNSTAYTATTSPMANGSEYGVSETSDGTLVGAACTVGSATNPSYALIGYSVGDTLIDAAQASVSATAPDLTNITSDKYVVVWNSKCTANTQTTFQIHIQANLDGAEATLATANNYLFPMTATWQAANVNGGTSTSGTYTLGNGSDQNNPYQADTVAFQSPGSYTTAEVTDNTSNVLPIGAACVSGKYSLLGYKTSTVSFADAANATLSTTAPNFTNVSADQYVLVMDATCGAASGTLSGDVGTVDHGTLAVTSITPMNTTATADGTFANGWKYMFHITVPDNETNLSMKFGDWSNTTTTGTIPAANDIRISSTEADNNGTPPTMITAANTYSTPALHIVGDTDASTPGKQIDVLVETSIPMNTANGTYTTTYGVQTLP